VPTGIVSLPALALTPWKALPPGTCRQAAFSAIAFLDVVILLYGSVFLLCGEP